MACPKINPKTNQSAYFQTANLFYLQIIQIVRMPNKIVPWMARQPLQTLKISNNLF